MKKTIFAVALTAALINSAFAKDAEASNDELIMEYTYSVQTADNKAYVEMLKKTHATAAQTEQVASSANEAVFNYVWNAGKK